LTEIRSLYTLEDLYRIELFNGVKWDKNNIKFVADIPLVMLFSSLPTDIVHHILSYNENMKLRNGKYMGQVSKTDKRYELLLKIPRKFYNANSIYYKINHCYFLRVNEFLTIKVYLYFYLKKPVEYEYHFRISGRKYSYLPK
jgi:hypothetical protein